MRRFTQLLLLLAGLWLGGCGAPKMIGPASPVRVVVLDGALPSSHFTEETRIVGWWLSARDIHRDPNDGLHWGDLLAREMERTIPNLTVHSRLDLRAYMVRKEERLKSAYPRLKEWQIRELLAKQSPLDYGRSLGADFVLASRIQDSHLSHQRTFHWWSSVVNVEVQLWDVGKGEQVWSWTDRDRGMFWSVYGVMGDLARACARSAGRAGVFAKVEPVAPPQSTQ